MGVYIKGMTLDEAKWLLGATRENEIIEVKAPHGRLIDETKIEYVYGEVAYLKVSYLGDTSRVEFINSTDAPTVIEAEE